MDTTKTCGTTTHMTNFRNWKVDHRVAEVVETTCFRSFLHIDDYVDGEEIRHNQHLITALVKTYDDDKEVFKIGSEKIALTLEDMFYITGLQIDGYVVSGYESSDTKEECMKHLGLTLEEADKLVDSRQNKVSLSELKKLLEKVPSKVDSIDRYVKGYLLYLLGNLIFPLTRNGVISSRYLQFLDLEKINKYAWGAAALAHLMVSVKENVKKMKQVKGFTYALTVFALERVPSLRDKILLKAQVVDGRPASFPLYLGWLKTVNNPFKNTRVERTIETYLSIFNSVKGVDQIDWKPYSMLKDDLLEREKDHLWVMYSRAPCLHFGDLYYNPADIATKQFDITGEIMELKSKGRSFQLVKENRHKDKDWRTFKPKYQKAVSRWRNRHLALICNGVEIHDEFLNDDDMPDKESEGNAINVDAESDGINHEVEVEFYDALDEFYDVSEAEFEGATVNCNPNFATPANAEDLALYDMKSKRMRKRKNN